MRRGIIYRFNSMGLRKRLILAFATLIILPLLVQGLISLSILSDSVLDRYCDEMDYRFSQMEQRMDTLYAECREVLYEMSYQREIQQILHGTYEGENIIHSRYIVEKILLDGRLKSGTVYSIYVYDRDGNCYTNDYMDVIPYENVKDEIPKTGGHMFSTVVMNDLMHLRHYNDVIMGRPIFDESGRTRIGIVVLRTDAGCIRDLYDEAFDGLDACITVADSQGIVVSSDEYVSGMPLPEDTPWEELAENTIREQGGSVFFSNGADDRGWTYLARMDSSIVNAARRELQTNSYITVAVALVLSALVLIYLSVDEVSPIKRLTESIEKFENAETAEMSFKPQYHDEIGRLAGSYNSMICRLKASVDRIRVIEHEKQRAEIRMLEAQISPHFLYNTLSSIIWLVHKDQKQDAIEMMEALARLYQISLSRGREIITLEEEFNHAESYLKIQKKRYQGNFEYELCLDPEISECTVVKVVLQPLIENAIYHGVRLKNGEGRIIVTGDRYEDGRIHLVVLDDANQLGEDGCAGMNRALAGETEGTLGVGVSNVQARLRLFYGEDFSMHYEVRDGFTAVEIVISARGRDADE